MRKLRISAISFLNTAPLMWDFEHGTAGEDFDISYTVPSQCADALLAGTADIGIIPTVTYASIPELVILPDVAIAATGPVRSILLISKMPLADVKTVAADTSSRTTVMLTRLLFRKWWGGDRELLPMRPDPDAMLDGADAAVIIGDPALRVDRTKYLTYDLAEEWQHLTGKPFVFAFWAVRLRALNDMRSGLDISKVFRESRDHGLSPSAVDHIVQEWAPKVGLSQGETRDYITRNIHYSLDRQCTSGLELFYTLLVSCGLLREAPPLRFLCDLRLLRGLNC